MNENNEAPEAETERNRNTSQQPGYTINFDDPIIAIRGDSRFTCEPHSPWPDPRPTTVYAGEDAGQSCHVEAPPLSSAFLTVIFSPFDFYAKSSGR